MERYFTIDLNVLGRFTGDGMILTKDDNTFEGYMGWDYLKGYYMNNRMVMVLELIELQYPNARTIECHYYVEPWKETVLFAGVRHHEFDRNLRDTIEILCMIINHEVKDFQRINNFNRTLVAIKEFYGI